MMEKRGLMIARHARRGTGIPTAYYQTITCLEMKCDSVVCKGLDSKVKYHYIEIPILSSCRDAVAYFGSVDRMVSFFPVNFAAFNAKTRRFGRSGMPLYMIIQDKAIIKNPPNGVSFMLEAVLNDPAHGLCGQKLDDFLYPIDTGDVHEFTIMCLKQILSTLNIPPDPVNDAANPVQAAKPATLQ